MNGSWEEIYIDQGRVQIDVLDTAIDAVKIFKENNLNTILDLGCGTGRHTLYLASEAFQVHACDLSLEGIKITKSLLEEHGYREITYSQQNMFDLTLKDNSYDGILCLWVQGHGIVSEIAHGIKEAHRILRKDGIFYTDFILRTDQSYGLGTEIEPHTFIGGIPGEENIPHYYTTIEELYDLFHDYSEVTIQNKTYVFYDKNKNQHQIKAATVVARK